MLQHPFGVVAARQGVNTLEGGIGVGHSAGERVLVKKWPLVVGTRKRFDHFQSSIMLGVEGYGSDDNSDSESAPAPAPVVRKLPATSTKPAKRPKKITIDLPKPTANADEDEDEKPAKRPRLDGLTKGAGISGLVSMLPAPKQQNPIPTRVLGGGKGPGLVFNSSRPVEEESASGPSPSLFMPTSVSRGKPNISTEESTPRAKGVGVDFFSIREL